MKSRKRQFAVACLSILIVSGMASATATITLTTDALGLGSTEINRAGNGSAVEADRTGLYTSSDNNVGSVLTIREDRTAGAGSGANPLLVTVTARSHMDIQNGLPAGYDIHGGVITLTKDKGDLAKEGLGVRAFGIDTGTAARYVNSAYTSTNVHGFQMEGSGDVSGGTNGITNWLDYVDEVPGAPHNDPPHVDEDVTFDFNDDLFSVTADSITVWLTKIGKVDNTDPKPYNLGLDLTVNLTDGSTVFRSFGSLYDNGGVSSGLFSLHPDYSDVLQINFSGGALGLSSTDIIDSFVIGARDDTIDDPKGTDEHFLINGFSYDATVIPAPGSLLLGGMGVGIVSWLRKRRAIA